jgi:hypothetical protein
MKLREGGMGEGEGEAGGDAKKRHGKRKTNTKHETN